MVLRDLKEDIVQRCGGRCEHPLCRKRTRLDGHHVTKRSQGAPEEVDSLDNLVAVCRQHHDMTDRVATDGEKELLVEAVGLEGFYFSQWIAGRGERVVMFYVRPLPLDGPQRRFQTREILQADRLNAAIEHGFVR